MPEHRPRSSSQQETELGWLAHDHPDLANANGAPGSSDRGKNTPPLGRSSGAEQAQPLLLQQESHEARPTAQKLPSKPVSWLSLPRKDQLAILTLARLAEPLSQTSLQAYMYYMLKSFDESLSDPEIASQAGLLTGSFTAMQCLTAVWWGRVADKEWMGRKNVLLIGLLGTLFSTVGFGFSKSFASAMFFRSLSGCLNGNVGVMRTMISEIIKEKKFQTKAFLILPVTFNFGILVGPLLGGFLQNPVQLYPNIFGPGSRLGGANGVSWMIEYPYAFPNVLNAGMFVISLGLVFFGLEETLIDRVERRRDIGVEIGSWLAHLFRRFFRRGASNSYIALHGANSTEEFELANRPSFSFRHTPKPSVSSLAERPKLPYRRIFTRNVLYTLLTHGLLHMHTAAFNNLWFLFLSTPRFDPAHPEPPSHTAQRLPFSFTGGLGLPPPTIGLAIGIIGLIGITLQFGVYPRVTHRLGIVPTFRLALLVSFPFVYLFVPYLAVVHTSSPSPAPADGFFIWLAISSLLFVQVMGRTFILPITQILVNNCTPHPSVLGSVHGIGMSVSSGCRTLGPVVWSYLYGVGLLRGVVGTAWWVLSVEALCAAATSFLLREGTGHEIWLPGD